MRSARITIVAVVILLTVAACQAGAPTQTSSGSATSVAAASDSAVDASPTASPGGASPAASGSEPVAATGDATAVAAGSRTCALLSGGGVACWGSGTAAEVTDGYLDRSLVPVAVAGISDATALSVGRAHTCAVRADGTVACWGGNGNGQFGIPDPGFRISATPVLVPGITSATAVAAQDHTCALLAEGTVHCWGTNVSGQLGSANPPSNGSRPLPPGPVTLLSDATAIGVGGNASCAVRSSGGVWCWGSLGSVESYGPDPVPVPGIDDATAIAVGSSHACALQAGGGVACWGDNSDGQLGVGLRQLLGGSSPEESATALAVVGISDAIAISAFNLHTCALLSGGDVVCWGRNGSGENGDGTTETSWTPVFVAGVTDAVGIAAGIGHGCALMSNGGITCWGSNYDGNLGDGTFDDSLTPVAVVGL